MRQEPSLIERLELKQMLRENICGIFGELLLRMVFIRVKTLLFVIWRQRQDSSCTRTSTHGPRITDHGALKAGSATHWSRSPRTNYSRNVAKWHLKVRHPWVSQGCRRCRNFTPNCDQSVQIRQFITFLPHFGHKISTLRHPCDTCSTPKVSKLKTAYTKGSKRITWLIYLLRHLLGFFSAIREKKYF